ncbi:MAG: hypothetical protein WD096_09960 [Actinomycetota bacterium]
MSDLDPECWQQDQLSAALRDLLAKNGLEAVQARGLEPEWLDTHRANDLVGVLLETSVKAGRDGLVLLFAGIDLSPDLATYITVLARKIEDHGTG